MTIGLYFGSFNPIHTGHLIIANAALNFIQLHQVWFVLSPQNPLKNSAGLLNEYHRLHLVNCAIQNNAKFKSSDIEFKLPRPSYTIDTLTYLSEKYPSYTFKIIMGSDSFKNLVKWKNYELLIKNYEFIVYERPDFPISNALNASIQVLKAPLLDISATYIRTLIKERKSIQYLVTDEVAKEIENNNYYK